MQTLFIDPGTKTGWALTAPVGTLKLSGSINLEVGGATESVRLARLAKRYCEWMAGLVEECEAQQLVIERVGGSPFLGQAGRVLPGIAFVALGIAEHHGLAVAEVVSDVWKKAVCGHGKATKPQIMTAVRRLGYAPRNQDEADVLGLRHYWLNRAGPTIDLPIEMPTLRKRARRSPRLKVAPTPTLA